MKRHPVNASVEEKIHRSAKGPRKISLRTNCNYDDTKLVLGPNLIILDLGQLLWERGIYKIDVTNLVYQRMFQHPKIN